MFVLAISRPSLNMGHVGLEIRSPGQILGYSCLLSKGHICDPILMKLCQNVCFLNLGKIRKYVMSGQKLGHQVKSYEILVYTIEATFATSF